MSSPPHLRVKSQLTGASVHGRERRARLDQHARPGGLDMCSSEPLSNIEPASVGLRPVVLRRRQRDRDVHAHRPLVWFY